MMGYQKLMILFAVLAAVLNRIPKSDSFPTSYPPFTFYVMGEYPQLRYSTDLACSFDVVTSYS